MKYSVTHRTIYTYDDHVSDSYGVAYVTPRTEAWQQVERSSVDIVPAPSFIETVVDLYGNTMTSFEVRTPHVALEVIARSLVEVTAHDIDADRLDRPWQECRPMSRSQEPGAWRAVDLALASPLVEHIADAQEYAATSLTPDRCIGEAVIDLMHRIHTDFRYEPGATTVSSTISEVLETRAGVCQDFAHLMLACLRTHGLAARYVSGYLSTDPPPGQPRMVGADASHAWVAVWLGDDVWLALDPTNDLVVTDRHVTVAWGRDYGDVPPLKGVIFSEATTSTLAVEVDVEPVQS